MYQFLIIAYLFTLKTFVHTSRSSCIMTCSCVTKTASNHNDASYRLVFVLEMTSGYDHQTVYRVIKTVTRIDDIRLMASSPHTLEELNNIENAEMEIS